VAHAIPPAVETFGRIVLGPLRRYHRFRCEGLHHVPDAGPAMVLLHHSLATYDAFFIGQEILETCGRQPLGLGDDNLFKVPGVKQLCWSLGIRPARPTTGEEVLADGDLLMLAPGGTREALRPSTQRYRPLWYDRFGWARLAIKMQVPVLVAGCPAGDDIYRVYDSQLTRSVYRRTRWPLPIARGLGPTAIPRPVKLTGYIGAPLVPPKASPDDDQALRAFHRAGVDAMTQLLAQP